MKIYFITEDESIRKELLNLGFNDFIMENPREYISNFIKTNTNFCRPTSDGDMFPYLLDGLLQKKYTTLFMHGGYKIGGLLNFFILKKDKTLVIDGMCVPEGEPTGTGKLLVSATKELAKSIKMNDVSTISLSSAVGFYKK